MVNPPIPALIIGLGGSGAATVMHVKEQLLNTYNNQLPDNVGLLVFDTSQMPLSQFNKGGGTRKSGMGYGKITLDPREFGHIGGNSRNMMERVALQPDTDENRHLSSWLEADWYMRNLPQTLFNLEDGAGQYRQLGRLALFKDVASANNSSFYQRINEKLVTIKRRAGAERSLAVFIVGSMVGGTGAGLFLDAAYLVRKIAEAQRFEVQLRGYFYMPDAFRATLDIGQIDNSKPRTFAAMRELGRLLVNEDYEIGYPIDYTRPSASASNNIWRSQLQTRLYDLTYLVDGTRERNPMNSVSLAKGSAPSIADSILAFIDSDAGEYQRSYIVNIAQQVADRRQQVGGVPFVGGLGTYTIILPIQQIIEKWSYTLGKEIMHTLVMPQEIDQTSKLPSRLSFMDNDERSHPPEAEVEQLFAARNAVVDPRDTSLQYFPTALWPKLFRWYTEVQQDETRAVRTLVRYDAEEWISALEPAAADKSNEARRALKVIESVRNRTMSAQIELSHETKADPESDYRRIRNAAEKELNVQLGQIRSTGQRDGGVFGDALGDLAQIQFERFRGLMEVFLLRQLNGEDDSDFIRARKGKFGWTVTVLKEIERLYVNVLRLIDAARSYSNSSRSDRSTLLQDMEDVGKAMEETAKAGGFRSGAKNRNAQEAYLSAAEAVLDLGRAEAARDTVSRLVEQMRDYVRDAISQLEHWAQIIATDNQGLYAQVYQGEQQVLSQLNDSRNDYPSRYVIDDPDWERNRYQAYIGSNNEGIQQALKGLKWHTEFRSNERGQPTLEIAFTVNGEKLDATMKGDWQLVNASKLMAYCRDVFGRARETESVLNYLATEQYKGAAGEERLAEQLFRESGALISYDDQYVGNTIPNVYLLAHQNDSGGDSADHREYIKRVMNHLRGHYGLPEDDDTRARLQSCDDRFRLMMVNMVELLPLPRIQLYEDYQQAYLGQKPGTRSLLHIFPAEVHTVRYEDNLVRVLNQPNRIISDKIAILLENIDKLRDFLMLMAHGIVNSRRDPRDNKNTHFVYILTTPAKEAISGKQSDEWWLTMPSPEPELIEAMLTYLFRGKDHGLKRHIPNYEFPIDYDWVDQHLNNMRQHQTNQNIQAGPGAFFEPISSWLVELGDRSPKFNVLARTTTEYMAIERLHNWMRDQLNGGVAAGSEAYDLYSICVLILTEMMKAKQKDAENIYNG